ncbi:short-chain dehydrogenase [Virgibacillus profundi]|uniref:Short-chain dehydrogenase n=1 Tax=Virgibacillus profundi TaxID=2024555 RepID=A0A2A2IDD8_9BACI|nr:(S)-benzoin forming benzil reductase [Virgibacillus profundi]PAV29336.1 short-chain dehydrogenase [Virgibacillus profundi]PXY53505.1 (S)-benzoin forming benzil reductase [Virgibacillus profundi]
MKFAVITGVSRGLGQSVAELFLEQGIHVIGISRSNSETLNKVAEQNNVSFQQFSCDLSDLKAIEETFNQITNEIFNQELSGVYLVNNAAVLEPMDQAMNINGEDLAYHVQVNTIAPMVLTNLFLKKASDYQVPLIAAAVTSGAAERPVYGWSAYCSTKASLNMYTETVALEQDQLNTEHKLIAFSPGIMDTAMQEKIRSSSEEEFADVETFKDYKKNKLLKDTDAVGGVLVDILTDEASIINGKVYNVKEYL